MHSTLVRAQNVFGFFTTVAFSVAALVAFTSFITPTAPSAKLQLHDVQVVRGRPHYYSTRKEEYAFIRFDLDADLTSLFNWNTKQVFLYITATYPSTKPNEPPSQAIIWDAILPSLSEPWHHNQYIHPDPSGKQKKNSKKFQQYKAPYEPGELHLSNQRPKYQITDNTGKIANRTDAVLELGWNIQPWVGALTWTNKQNLGFWKGLDGGVTENFNFPAIGVKPGTKDKDLKTEKGGEGNRGKPA